MRVDEDNEMSDGPALLLLSSTVLRTSEVVPDVASTRCTVSGRNTGQGMIETKAICISEDQGQLYKN